MLLVIVIAIKLSKMTPINLSKNNLFHHRMFYARQVDPLLLSVIDPVVIVVVVVVDVVDVDDVVVVAIVVVVVVAVAIVVTVVVVVVVIGVVVIVNLAVRYTLISLLMAMSLLLL